MAIELKVPTVGESITEVEIARWLKRAGERVEKDEKIVEIETDKVTVEFPSPAAGVIAEIVLNDGAEARVGDVMGHLEPADGAAVVPSPAETPRADPAPPVPPPATPGSTPRW